MRHHHIAKAAALMLVILLQSALWGCTNQETSYKIALISSMATGHYWENIIEGAQTAAERMGVTLVCYAPDEENGVTVDQLAAMAAEDGADAILAASLGEEELVASLQPVHLPLIAIGTAFSHPTTVSTILNDDTKTGHNIVKALADNLEKGDTVLLLADNAEYKTSEQRELTMRQDLEDMGASVKSRIYCGDNREWAYRQALQQLYLTPDLDAIVAFSAQSTVGAAMAAKYLGRNITVIGTDVVPDLIACIEDESVDATIVRNSFGMGYLGVEYALDALRGEFVPKRKTLSSVVVTLDNLFTPEIEKIIFTFE